MRMSIYNYTISEYSLEVLNTGFLKIVRGSHWWEAFEVKWRAVSYLLGQLQLFHDWFFKIWFRIFWFILRTDDYGINIKLFLSLWRLFFLLGEAFRLPFALFLVTRAIPVGAAKEHISVLSLLLWWHIGYLFLAVVKWAFLFLWRVRFVSMIWALRCHFKIIIRLFEQILLSKINLALVKAARVISEAVVRFFLLYWAKKWPFWGGNILLIFFLFTELWTHKVGHLGHWSVITLHWEQDIPWD